MVVEHILEVHLFCCVPGLTFQGLACPEKLVLGTYLVALYAEPILTIRRIRKLLGPRNTRGGPCSQRLFNFSFVFRILPTAMKT